MIWEKVFDFVVGGVAVWFTTFLPDGTWTGWNLTPAFSAMMTFDRFLPVSETLTAVGVLAGIAGAIFAYGLLKQILRFVPFLGMG